MKKIELEDEGPCSFKCILVMIMATLIVQVFLMTLPVGVGVVVYGRHHEKFEAAGNLDAKAIVSNVNHIRDFPIKDLMYRLALYQYHPLKQHSEGYPSTPHHTLQCTPQRVKYRFFPLF